MLLDDLTAACGSGGVVTDARELESYLVDWRGMYRGTALAAVRPATTEQVASCVRACARAGVAIVPQGGNTGLAAGATPIVTGDAVVMSTSRMRRVLSVDAAGFTMEVEAGCVLADVQQAAAGHGRLFPLSLAAQGTAQIGGLISTNAGGTAVLRYGTMRSLVLGLEVVLPDGTIADGMRALRKDNAGYDWRQLFIGAEGTLGIITAAVLRLFPRPSAQAVALIGLGDVEDAVGAFSSLQASIGEALVAAELFSDLAVRLRMEHDPTLQRPMQRHPWYLLVEAASSLPGLHEGMEAALERCVLDEFASDVVVAANASQAQALWSWRESITETERREGRSAKHDVSVPISAIPQFIAQAAEAIANDHPGARVLAFGHIGDGNIHFNVLLAGNDARDVNTTVHGIVLRYRGSITAEHGIGRYRREELPQHRSPEELSLMRAIKTAVDPDGRMNPGAVL